MKYKVLRAILLLQIQKKSAPWRYYSCINNMWMVYHAANLMWHTINSPPNNLTSLPYECLTSHHAMPLSPWQPPHKAWPSSTGPHPNSRTHVPLHGRYVHYWGEDRVFRIARAEERGLQVASAERQAHRQGCERLKEIGGCWRQEFMVHHMGLVAW